MKPCKGLFLYIIPLLLAACGGGGGEAPAVPSTSGLNVRPASLACVAPALPATQENAVVGLTQIFSNLVLDRPVALLQAPGNDARWYLVEQGGRVMSFTRGSDDSAQNLTTFTQFPANQIQTNGEAGLLGMAFHPEFATNRQVFLSYTRPGTVSPLISRVSRFITTPDATALNPGIAEEVLLAQEQPYLNHNGGHIAFGADGYLYIGLGDGGSGNDPLGNAQDRSNLLGALLRIDVDRRDDVRGTAYAIPADNPYADAANCDDPEGCRAEIFAYGFRNPWRWSFDREKQALATIFLGDVGQEQWEEINQVQSGGNYGWNVVEGNQCLDVMNCETSGLIAPLVAYSHANNACSVTGGYVYRGTAIPALQGQYLYADYCNGRISRVTYDAQGQAEPALLIASGLTISSFAQDAEGELYVLDHAAGRVFQLVEAAAPIAGGGFPENLADTGCVNPLQPQEPAQDMIPYDVNGAFYSDGALKQRWMAIPGNGQITISADGDWQLPVGSVLMKHFRVAGQLIETRLFARHGNGVWAGYSYEWNDSQTAATRVSGGKTRRIGQQEWIFPHSAECLQCHTEVAGWTLGLETAQMNRSIFYPDTGRTANQLSTYDAIGLFVRPLTLAPSALDSLEPLAVSGQVPADPQAQARSYLHVNCAQCHRPGGPTPVDMDLRYATELVAMNICNQPVSHSTLGISGVRRLVPGEADKSMLLQRVMRRDAHGMPPLGSHIPDSFGVSLLRDWITGLSACP